MTLVEEGRFVEDDRLQASQQGTPKRLNILFAIIGIGYLFPFSALTQPVDYWTRVFPDFNIEFYITSIFLYTNLLTLGLVVAFAPTSLTNTARIVGGFLGQLAVLVFVPLAKYLSDSTGVHTVAVLGATTFAAIATAFLDSCVIALAAKYPTHAQAALQFGVGLSSLVGSLYRVLTKVVFAEDDVILSSSVYFFTGAATIVVCIVAYYMLLRVPIGRVEDGYQQVNTGLPPPNRWKVVRKSLKQQLLVVLIFMTTLCLWPPLVTEIKSVNFPTLQKSGWWPLILLTEFSIADCLGRLAVPYRFGVTKDNIWKPIMLRILLVPCILLSVHQLWFIHEAWSIIFVAILGITNGYHGSLSIIFVTESVDDDERAIAGSFTSFFLISGLVLGSSIGLGFSHTLNSK